MLPARTSDFQICDRKLRQLTIFTSADAIYCAAAAWQHAAHAFIVLTTSSNFHTISNPGGHINSCSPGILTNGAYMALYSAAQGHLLSLLLLLLSSENCFWSNKCQLCYINFPPCNNVYWHPKWLTRCLKKTLTTQKPDHGGGGGGFYQSWRS